MTPAWPRLLVTALAATALAASCARSPSGGPAAFDTERPYFVGRCPLPPSSVGYPLTVVALGDAPVDSAWLTQWARAAAYRWQVPSRRRAQHTGYARVTSRLLPDVPRWADDWKPAARHRAEVMVAVSRSEGVGDFEPRESSGDPLFDQSLFTILDDPMPASPRLPLPPEQGPESVRLLLRFGGEPQPGERAGVVRFTRQQRPVGVMPGWLTIRGGPADRAVVKYDVGTDGRVVPASVQVLESSGPRFARAVEDRLYQARFTPAQGDCSAIRLTVVQIFDR